VVLIGVIVGAVWVLLLMLVLAICRAAGGADAHEDGLVRARLDAALRPEPDDLTATRASVDRVPSSDAAAALRPRRHRRPRLPTKVA
jgi:hypothetical protein